MEDNFVSERLKEWGLEQLIVTFEQHQIDRETFLTIPEEGIKQVIDLVGWRYRFLRKREEYLSKHPKPNTETVPMPSTSYRSNLAENESEGAELRQVFKSNLESVPIPSTSYWTYVEEIESEGEELRHVLKPNLKSVPIPSTSYRNYVAEIESEGQELRQVLKPKSKSVPIPSTSNQNYVVEIESEGQESRQVLKPKSKSVPIPSTSYRSNVGENEREGEELRKVLKSNLTGRYLLKKNFNLDATDRTDLVRIIIEHQMLSSLKIKKEQFMFWAHQITLNFPNENGETYYIPYKKDESVASGKLYDKYANLRRKLLAIDCSEVAICNNRITEDTSSVDKLRSVSIDNIVEIKDLWSKTHSLRMVELEQAGNVTDYFDKYPFLKNPIGSSLINLDFKILHETCDDNIFAKVWPDVSAKLVKLASKKQVCIDIIKNFDIDTPNEIKGLLLLPYFFRPTQAKSETAKKWVPSYKEQAESFILNINQMNDFQTRLEQRILELKKHRSSSQPFVLIVGNPNKLEASFVIIEQTKYKFQNIFAAMDTCFKAFFALNLKYPAQSKLAWIFIERRIYGIKSNLKCPPAVSSLLSDVDSQVLTTCEEDESL